MNSSPLKISNNFLVNCGRFGFKCQSRLYFPDQQNCVFKIVETNNMNVIDKLLTQLLCRIMSIFPTVLGYWPGIPGQEINVPKVFKVSELNSAAKITRNPLEILNNNCQRFRNICVTHSNCKEVQEKLSKFKKGSNIKERETVNKDIDHLQERYIRNFNKLVIKKKIFNENQSTFVEKDKIHSKSFENIREILKGPKNDITELLKETETFWKIKEDLIKSNGGDLNGKLRQNLLQILKTSTRKSSKEKRNGRIPIEYRSLGEHGFKSMNYITYSNRYQIGNIFIFNELSEKKKNSISKFNKYKEPEDKIFYKSAESNMKALLDKKMNNLEKEPKSETTYDSPLKTIKTPQLLQIEPEPGFNKELKTVLSKILFPENRTLKELNRMYKIVKFVEKYHGIINNSKYLEDFKEEKGEPYLNYEIKEN